MNPYTKVCTTLASIQYHSISIFTSTTTHLQTKRVAKQSVSISDYLLYADTYCSNSVYIFRARNGFRRIVVHLTITNVFFTFLILFFSIKGWPTNLKKKHQRKSDIIST